MHFFLVVMHECTNENIKQGILLLVLVLQTIVHVFCIFYGSFVTILYSTSCYVLARLISHDFLVSVTHFPDYLPIGVYSMHIMFLPSYKYIG